MYFLYNALLNAAFLATLPYTAAAAALDRQQMRQRLGLGTAGPFRHLGARKPIWLHAASMGEAGILPPVAAELKKAVPDRPLIISTVTTSGLERARKLIPGAALYFILPLDVSHIIGRAVRLLSPSLLIITETELWPNLLRRARRTGAATVLINGRISDKSYGTYRFLRPLFKLVVRQLDLVGVQTSKDKAKFLQLGASKKNVRRLGNIKFDFSTNNPTGTPDRASLRRQYGIPAECRLLVAGSTRPGEEEIIMDACEKLWKRYSNLFCIIVPRHLQRVPEIETLLATRRIAYTKRTEQPSAPDGTGAPVLILDTMGELQQAYAAADIALVGGSLADFGGHNPLEPALHRVPVVFGPHMNNNLLSARLLLEKNGAVQADDPARLDRDLATLLDDPEGARRTGENGYEVIRDNRGTVVRYIDVMKKRDLL